MNINENVIPLNATASRTATGVQVTSASLSGASGMIGAQGSLGNYGYWYPNQTIPNYTYYWYPVTQAPAYKPKVADLIALYKKEFGKNWKRMFAQTVRIEAQ